jgi:hypothetical protein
MGLDNRFEESRRGVQQLVELQVAGLLGARMGGVVPDWALEAMVQPSPWVAAVVVEVRYRHATGDRNWGSRCDWAVAVAAGGA